MQQQADATLTRSTGPAFAERNGVKIPINEGDAIFEADLIITGDQTTIDISFRDGTKSRIGPDSEMRIIDFEFTPDEEPSFVVNLTQGAMRTVTGEIVKLNPEAFSVTTPRATAGIRGTEFLTEVRGDMETHVVLFISGESVMLVTNTDGAVQSFNRPLQGTTIDANNSMSVKSYSMNDVQSLINQIAPSLGGNIPTSESEQGKWTDANHLTEATHSTVTSGVHIDIVYDNAETLKVVLEALQNEAGILVNSVTPQEDITLLEGELAPEESEVVQSLESESLYDENGVFTEVADSIFAPTTGSGGHGGSSSSGGIGSGGGSVGGGIGRLFIYKNLNTTVEGTSGNDVYRVTENVNGSGYLDAKEGHNHITINGNVNGNVIAGSGNDYLNIKENLNGSGKVHLGDGDNTIIINGQVNGSITTGRGDDYIRIDDDVNSSAYITTGAGDDVIYIKDDMKGEINAGAGNDLIILEDDVSGTVHGGSGTDIVVQHTDSPDLNSFKEVEAVIYGDDADKITSSAHLNLYGISINANGSIEFGMFWKQDPTGIYYHTMHDISVQLFP